MSAALPTLIRCLLLAVTLFAFSSQAFSATLFGVVSERNAASMAEAAQAFNAAYPQHRLVLRTSAQIEAMSQPQLQKLLDEADAILLATVFKETAQRLLSMLPKARATAVIALAGDPALGRFSRWRGIRLFTDTDPRYDELSSLTAEKDASAAAVAASVQKYPALAPWIRARGYWQNRGERNLQSLLALMLSQADRQVAALVKPIDDVMPLSILYGKRWPLPEQLQLGHRKVVAILDNKRADTDGTTEANAAMCRALESRDLDCLFLFAGWGKPSSDALQILQERVGKQLGAVVSLQDFIIGGSSDHQSATRRLEQLDVPVFKAIRLHDVTAAAWHGSEQGLAWDSVYYRISMPEIQGLSQPIVVSAAAEPTIDALTGIAVSRVTSLDDQVATLANRVQRWVALQSKRNADKRVAIVYYNHPPGRHNIGADNLDVPASLLQLLQDMKRAGYDTGALPATSAQLLEMLQKDGVNLPEQADALRSMSSRVATVSAEQYASWFKTLPAGLRSEMESGPLGLLQVNVRKAREARLPIQARGQVTRTLHELEHLVEGVKHPARARALDLLKQLSEAYESLIAGTSDDQRVGTLSAALIATGIEGLRGWGAGIGKVMVDRGKMVLPGLRFGKVFVGPQPPRGWEINEELLHANTSIPPPHQYLGFYFWLKQDFRADAIVHLGRHSTYEFLPRKAVGLDAEDYSMQIAGEVPGIYPYIVDGVGEGLQAKRRGLAVMIDHLIPPLTATPLYDDLLRLRQLVESYETATNPALRQQATAAMRKLIDELHLREALTASMDEELKIRGIRFEEAEDELLVHEIGHYLTHLQEDFMPLGLHIFGKPWSRDALQTMLTSMQRDGKADPGIAKRLEQSPASEMHALLHALSGRFVIAGPGNDPIRNPEALPTGRNFHGLDNSLIPSRIGYALGQQLATQARSKVTAQGKEAVILWASDSVRDEGAMVGFGMALLGVVPQWNSRGIVAGLARVPLADGQVRADTLFVTSGLFRDLFGQQIGWLDQAVLLAIDGSRSVIEREHPEMRPALAAALAPLGPLATGGNESLQSNYVAQHWVTEATALMKSGVLMEKAGVQASLRVFGTAQGDYGAGINRLVERSGSWTDRKELASTYLARIGFAYTADGASAPQQQMLENNLRKVRNTYLGRASNLYGLMDNNDAFDYLGGLSLAIESVSGKVPASFVADHLNAAKPQMQPLPAALVAELRGRYLNPAWIKPLMAHGYAGARTMGSEFTEYLWGWQVTNPDIIKSWAWDEVKDVYLDDRYQLGLAKFLEQGSNVHVKTNMMAILLVAAQKGFWQTDAATLAKLSQQWVDLLIANGLPGSGHTRPDHPVFEWVRPMLREDQREPLKKLLDRAQIKQEQPAAAPSTLTELQKPTDAAPAEASVDPPSNQPVPGRTSPIWLFALAIVGALVWAGFIRGRAGFASHERNPT